MPPASPEGRGAQEHPRDVKGEPTLPDAVRDFLPFTTPWDVRAAETVRRASGRYDREKVIAQLHPGRECARGAALQLQAHGTMGLPEG